MANANELSVLDQFYENLQLAVELGNDRATADLHRFENLSVDQKLDLESFFNGYRELNFSTLENDNTLRDGDFSLERSLGVFASLISSTSNRHIQSSDEFKFAGISITRTKVSGSYEATTGAGATRILSHQCIVEHNYDPLAQVNSEKQDSYVSSGNATFLCRVQVRLGVPTPWGQINWSDRTASQGVVGNGNGVVINQGWM